MKNSWWLLVCLEVFHWRVMLLFLFISYPRRANGPRKMKSRHPTGTTYPSLIAHCPVFFPSLFQSILIEPLVLAGWAKRSVTFPPRVNQKMTKNEIHIIFSKTEPKAMSLDYCFVWPTVQNSKILLQILFYSVVFWLLIKRFSVRFAVWFPVPPFCRIKHPQVRTN